ncbi:MAG: DNA-3-methyladenine glycosylase I [Rhodocyclaceae bacterium]|nr:DNA-3-methyladenine glycosylase I [Rhodocyclaceae bacterium]
MELKQRCPWCGTDPLYVAYHDTEWGVPQHDDSVLFEFLLLEGAQAGLSWITILRKRENYRRAFDGFDVERVACYTEADIARLLSDPGIVRNRLKINAALTNARAFLKVQEAFGSFDTYLWRFTNAMALSKDLKARGFRFVGPTICTAFMQAVGLVNDHLTTCFRYLEISPPPLPNR